LKCPLKEESEFDVLVTSDAWVWRKPQAILLAEVVNNESLEFCSKAELMERYIYKVAGMLQIGDNLILVVVFP